MAVLITGGAGFVGLNVAEQLLRRGETVVLFGPAPPPAAAIAALREERGDLIIVTGDVRNASDLDSAFTGFPIDRLVHGAAITSDLAREARAARDIFTVNLMGTIEVLEAALRHRARRVVQLGSGAIFGAAGTASPMLDEQASPAMPESLYGISKFAAERTGLRYRHTRNVNLVVARLAIVFGRWEYETGVRDTLSLPMQLLRAAQSGETAVVHRAAGDDWVYATDVAHGIIALLDRDDASEPVYHISSGMRWPVDEWCRLMAAHIPTFRYEFADALEGCTVGRNAPGRRSPLDIQRMRRDVGYEPAYLIDRAFADFVDWHARICLDQAKS